MLRPATSKRLQTRGALLAALLLATTISAAQAAPIAAVSGQPGLSAIERTLIDENPVLQELGAMSPDLQRTALDMIAAAMLLEPTTRGGLLGLEPEDAALFGSNPALLQVWKNSPEASADLLELIRTAAGSGKSQK